MKELLPALKKYLTSLVALRGAMLTHMKRARR